jgi:hypothetical protein
MLAEPSPRVNGTDEERHDAARSAHHCMPHQPRYLGGQHAIEEILADDRGEQG